jgi:hypothetical protein
MALSLRWFNGQETKEEKEEKEVLIRNSTRILELVSQVIQKQLDELAVTKTTDYDKPGYPYYRADRDGQIRVLTQLLQTITTR